MANICNEHTVSYSLFICTDTNMKKHKNTHVFRHPLASCDLSLIFSQQYTLGFMISHQERNRDAGIKKTRNRHTQTNKRVHMLTYWDRYGAAVSLKQPAVSIFVPEETCQTPVVTGSQQFHHALLLYHL